MAGAGESPGPHFSTRGVWPGPALKFGRLHKRHNFGASVDKSIAFSDYVAATLEQRMIAVINAGHFIDSEFPAKYRALIPAALKTAYAAVEDLYKTEVTLQVRSALAEKGHAVHWAVDHYIERLLKTAKLPFDYRWVSYQRPTGEYLQIRLPTSTMSISQLSNPANVPRHASFRHNRALNNAPFLNFPRIRE